ncbi:TetR/AcrR family transcriptional regulator [Demequina phytophila]|uniref:TetR/AcrR family transcriptional regulator n=1 Tax=Demequina phytophila TaxID=1638981 RepID=UPI0007856314|nr:TetR/AcrR family transcriptional regulator C-terminal domain-containing protein [Demequina phytophila]
MNASEGVRERRPPLTRARVLEDAVALADRDGLDAVSMRALADRLGVVPMALYKHVRDKEALLDGMIETVLAEIPPPGEPGPDWKTAARARVLDARRALQRHPWAWRVLETRAAPSPAMLDHMESMLRILRAGGVSAHLAHHAMHALGSRIWGFTQEVGASGPPPTEPAAVEAAMAAMAARWPAVLESAMSAGHDPDSAVGAGCDDDFEFAFALDLLLDGTERLHLLGWTPWHGVSAGPGR